MNETAAKEWLRKSWHHLSSGIVLFEANHYTDAIGIDLHYSVEIMLKSILAYQNKKIPKTHDLIEISSHIRDYITFSDDDLDKLVIISEYHIMESYPVFQRDLPERAEIREMIDFSQKLLEDFSKIFRVQLTEIKK